MTEKEKKDIVALFISEYQKGKEEKQGNDDRQKAQDSTHPVKDTVNDHCVDKVMDVPLGQQAVGNLCDIIDAPFKQLLKISSYQVEGQPKYQGHDEQEDRHCCLLAGQETVNIQTA